MDKFVVVQNSLGIEENYLEEDEERIEWSGQNVAVDSREIKIIRDFIEKRMNNSQKIQIVEIIKESNARYTINKNGYFINMNNIPFEILMKIKMFVDFTKENARELQKTEELLNEEKTRIESIDKIEDIGNFSNVGFNDENLNEKNINFEIYSLDTVQSEIFDEYREDDAEELEFCDKMVLNEKRDNSGYKIILKRYKKKYFGNKARILKKFRDISRSSINSKSAKTSLNQNVVKQTKSKVKKVVPQGVKIEDEENNEETNVEEYVVEEEEEEEEEEVEIGLEDE